MEGTPVVMNEGDQDELLNQLPPGFKFHPTDEEIISHYLKEKFMNNNFSARAMGEADLNKCEPWDLPKKAKMGGKEWFFFCQRDRKYPTGMRTNRATESGYWKATGKDKEIYKKNTKSCLIGMKKTLVFYKGRAPKGEKTNWVMHEYRLEGNYNFHRAPKDEWVVCKVFHKNMISSGGIKRSPVSAEGLMRSNSFVSDLLIDSPSLPPLLDLPYNDGDKATGSSFMVSSTKEEFEGAAAMASSSSARSSDFNYHPSDFFTGISTNSSWVEPIPYTHSFYFPQQVSSFFIPSYSAGSVLEGMDMLTGQARQCKAEQFSSNHSLSMATLSQDTGLSTDLTNEISSVASKQDGDGGGGRSSKKPFEDLEGVPSMGHTSDYDSLWNY